MARAGNKEILGQDFRELIEEKNKGGRKKKKLPPYDLGRFFFSSSA